MLGLTKEFKEKWLTALTDGSYVHYQGHLVSRENDNHRCCLGVAKALMGKYASSYDHYLKDDDLNELGLLDEQGEDAAIQYELAELNDNKRSSNGKYPIEVIERIKEIPVRGE